VWIFPQLFLCAQGAASSAGKSPAKAAFLALPTRRRLSFQNSSLLFRVPPVTSSGRPRCIDYGTDVRRLCLLKSRFSDERALRNVNGRKERSMTTKLGFAVALIITMVIATTAFAADFPFARMSTTR
jgi:hypothetical protein